MPRPVCGFRLLHSVSFKVFFQGQGENHSPKPGPRPSQVSYCPQTTSNALSFYSPAFKIKRHPYLETLGLFVNMELNNLCCESCGATCYAEHVTAHLKNKHSDANFTLDMGILNNICDKLQVVSKVPFMLPGIKEEYDGIRVWDGISCTHCEFACRSDQYMEEHHRKTHPRYTPSAKWPKVKVQRLNAGRGAASCYFQVRLRTTPALTADDITASQLSIVLSALGGPTLGGRADGRTGGQVTCLGGHLPF